MELFVMNFNHRSYNTSRSFRPKPLVHEDSAQGLFVFLTSWGDSQIAQEVLQSFLYQIQQSYDDDYTHAGPGLASDQESRLFAKPWKELIEPWVSKTHSQLTKRKQVTLIEFLALKLDGAKLSWAQLGQPNLFLARAGRSTGLSVQPDFGLLSLSSPPLPRAGLGGIGGVGLSMNYGEIQLLAQDQIICLARSWDPLWSRYKENLNFSDLSKFLVEDEPDQAFWLGVIEI
jgi:hypothetical protein